ncbi:MAG TPA: site-2 protease family protein [Roseiflexaceae bacterium]|nr:site-2 protease family protein [Roseiflexaceae bacterium]
MGWSFPIARIAGIDIKVHVTFFLILILGAVQGGAVYGAAGAAFGVLLMLLLFVCVTLHELGHSLTAQRLGIPVREIVLLPLGGVALMARNPSRAWHELLIAAAGPLVNVVIAAALLLVTGAFVAAGQIDMDALQFRLGGMEPGLASLLQWLIYANVALVLFNLIPAFPLDGGRIFRALLAMVMGFPRATRIAATVGQLIAIGLGVYGFVIGSIGLMLVAVFVFFGAGQENAAGQAQTMLMTLRVGDAYNRYALTLGIGDRVSTVVGYILTSYQPDFAVLQGRRLVGIVTRDDVLRSLATGEGDPYVTQVMQREIVRVDANDTLDRVREVMAEHGVRIVAVYDGENYLGLVSLDDMAEAYAVLTFLERQRRQAPAGARTEVPGLRAANQPQGTMAWSDTPGGAAVADQERQEQERAVAQPEAPQPEVASPERRALEQELQAKRRRLYALEVQYRYFGPKTPPQILSELQELRETVKELETKLSA